MIKTQVYCDFCEKPIPEDDYSIIRLSRTKFRAVHALFPYLCESCAEKLDNVLKIHEEALRKQSELAAKFAKANKDRRERLGTEG